MELFGSKKLRSKAILTVFVLHLSELGIKFKSQEPYKLIFTSISDPPNLDFCNTLKHFSWFSIIQQIASKMISKMQIRSKTAPKSFRNAPKRLPRHPQDKRPQGRPKRLQDPVKSPQDRQNITPRASKSSRNSPKRLQEAPKQSQEPPSSLPRPPKELPQGSKSAVRLSHLAC